MTTRIPLTFLAVLVGAIALTIFFGAWAVSTDLDGRYAELVTEKEEFVLAAPLNPKEGDTDEEEWWQKTLLFACPFH